MGCGMSSLPKPAGLDVEPESLQDIDIHIDYYVARMDQVTKKKNLDEQACFSIVRKLIHLMRKRAVLAGPSNYEACVQILTPYAETSGEGMAPGLYIWSLLQLSQVRYELFQMTSQMSDINDAIRLLVRYAQVSKDQDPDISVLLAKQLKAFCEHAGANGEIAKHSWMLETVWPKVKGTNVGRQAIRFLAYLWRLEWMETGNYGVLMACLSATRAALVVYLTEEPEFDCLEDLVKDLDSLEMTKYFLTDKPFDEAWRRTPGEVVPFELKKIEDETEIELGILPGQDSLYQALDIQKREIRLFDLQPGENEAPVVGRLITVSLDTESTFEALSYAAEDSKNNKTIKVNETSFGVTRNLHQGLRRVRHQSEARLIWVDAICVNKSDVNEKSTQVQLSKDIFSKAKNVLMYVSEPEDSSKEPGMAKWFEPQQPEHMDLYAANNSSERKDIYDWTDPLNVANFFHCSLGSEEWPVLAALCIVYFLAQDKHLGEIPFFIKYNKDQPRHDYVWKKSAIALQSLFSQVYWHRAFILQEIAVAQEPIVYYGNHIIPFRYFLLAHGNLMQHEGDCCKTIVNEDINSQEVFPGWRLILSGFLNIMQPTQYLMMQKMQSKGFPASVSFRQALENGTIWKDASDPKDFIHSSLGLILENTPKKFIVDYSLSTVDVFTQATARVFSDDTNISCLKHLDAGREVDFDIPSWVPDWRFTHLRIGRRGHTASCSALLYDEFRAAGKNVKFNGHLEKDHCLAVRSIKSDRITVVGTYWQPVLQEDTSDMTMQHLLQPIDNIVAQLFEWRRMAGLPETVNSESLSAREKQFWRTMFADTLIEMSGETRETRKMHSKDFAQIKSFYSSLQIADTSQRRDPMKQFDKPGPNIGALQKATVGRRFFITERGRFGLGLAGKNNLVETGDEVHVVEGSNLPIILRPTRVGDPNLLGSLSKSTCVHNGRALYLCLGFAYVEGVMNGEAMGRNRLEEVYLC